MDKQEKLPRMLLGLDVSTKCVGLTIASVDEENNVKVLEVTHIRPKISSKIKGTDAMLLKSSIIGESLKKYIDYHISEIIIEEPLFASNNSLTVANLLRFNGMVAQMAYFTFNVLPKFISSYDARKYAFPQLMAIRKFNKKGKSYDIAHIKKSVKRGDLVLFGEYSFDCAKKYVLWNFISEMYPDIIWQYDKHGNLKDENFDASDSLVCVLGFVNKQIYEKEEPKVLNYKIENNEIFYETKFCNKTFNKKIVLD